MRRRNKKKKPRKAWKGYGKKEADTGRLCLMYRNACKLRHEDIGEYLGVAKSHCRHIEEGIRRLTEERVLLLDSLFDACGYPGFAFEVACVWLREEGV